MIDVQPVPLHEAARERYLAYALSVVTSRALPDVRDGLKPVQRRILYTMFHELSLHPGGRYRKCAAVVGDVMGKYHPHGDQAIYDALVRMAQDFSLRAPLVDGQGNFGSLDGDPAAAMRYTECKLRPLAEELLTELKKRTVDYRPSYDGQRFEPIVLPAQFPQLLVNGSEGIAVGMATRIPPHHLGEIIDATIALSKKRSLTTADLVKYVRGPDFPTGGKLLNDAAEIRRFYEEGTGSFRIRATWGLEKDGRRQLILIDSIPYAQNKAKLLEAIGAEVATKRLPLVVGVRDESTEDIRIVLELKHGASAEAVMAYLFKHTRLEATFPLNLTALVPVPGRSDVAAPARLDLASVLSHWLDFRFETVRRRFEYDLQKLQERIEILEGFVLVFDVLDEVIAIIRASQGKRDAAETLMDQFDLTERQTDAILELRLYRLAQLEILLVREELEEKLAEAARIEAILSSATELWKVVRNELKELRKLYTTPRRTVVGEPAADLDYDEDAYIEKVDAYVVVTRDGWIKRQSSFSEIGKIRTRDDDAIGWLLKAHTRSTLTFFTSAGAAYVMRVDDVPATTGHGEPVQRHFNFGDGERVVGVVSHDARHHADPQQALDLPEGDDPPGPYLVAVTEGGRVLRFPASAHRDPSTRSGRKYARLNAGDAVFVVWPEGDRDKLALASRGGRALLFPLVEIPILKSSGKGVTGIKLGEGDRVVAALTVRGSLDGPAVVTNNGRELVVRERKFGVGKRGARGKVVLKRGSIDTWLRQPAVALAEDGPDPEDEPTEETSTEGGEP